MTKLHFLSATILTAAIALFAVGFSTAAMAGPASGAVAATSANLASSRVAPVHYRKKYHKHRRYRGYKYRRYNKRYRRAPVYAPYTYVSPRRGRVAVDAPFASVRVGRGVRVRAPFVDIWVPRSRGYYGYSRYW